MASGWLYRVTAVGGTAGLTAGAVFVANQPFAQRLVVAAPPFSTLAPTILTGDGLVMAVATATLVVLLACAPLYAPRPRRLLDTLATAAWRVGVAVTALATIGYFDYTYQLPRTTLLVAAAVLVVALPAWFGLVLRRPRVDLERAVVVGDDPDRLGDIAASTSVPLLGYVAPSAMGARSEIGIAADADADAGSERPQRVRVSDGGRVDVLADGGDDLPYLAGLSRFGEVLVDRDVDTAVLAFSEPNRAEFFGALYACYEHGVAAKVHRDHADTVLTTGVESGQLADIELEPWQWHDYVLKRAFDVVTATAGLVAFAPVMAAIAAAIRLDDGGSVLYRQERTAEFGDTFTIYKFRTMVPEGESTTPTDDDENDRITRVGRILRTTHLDELPQLWCILRGEMSVIGPRAAWVEEEDRIQAEMDDWRKRWFVKPGLTGLAQINDASSTDPAEKLRYDVAYIREQSFTFDLKILVRQVWQVVLETATAINRS